MRGIKVLAIIGLAVALAGALAVPVFAVARAEASIRSALGWTSASVATKTDSPRSECRDSNWNIFDATGPLVCRSPVHPQLPGELAYAFALARLGWSGRVEVTVRGSEAGAVVDVQGPDPKTLPNTLPAGSKFKITASSENVKREGGIVVTVTLFRRPQPANRDKALAPLTEREILASGTLALTGAPESLELTLKESASKDEIGIEVSGSSSVPVPTLTEWGLIVLGLLLAGSLAFMIRRRFAPKPAGA